MTASGDVVTERPTLSDRRVKLVFLGILLGATLSGLDASIVATAAPTIIGDLGRVSLLPWLTTSYLLAQVATMAVFGKLGDIHGRRRMFAIAIGIFLTGSVLCGLSTSMGMLILCRLLQGIGAGGITGLAMALVADLIPGDRLGRYLGYTGLVFAATSVVGPAAGGFFVDHFSWRWAFFVNVPSAVLCLVTLLFAPKQRLLVPHRIDIPGAVLLATALTTLLLALSNTDHSTTFWSSRKITLMTISAIAAFAFFLWERRAAEPLVPLRILATRVAALSTLANLLAGIGFTCGIIYPPIFYQAVSGVSAQNSGLLLAPFALTCAMSTLLAGQVTDRVGGHKIVPLIGSVFLALGYSLLGTITASTSVSQVTLYGMIGGFGVGLVMQTLLYVVQRFSRPSDMGVATSTVMLARVLGSSLGVAIMGSVFTSSLLTGVAERLPGFPVSDIQGDPHKVAALSDATRAQVQEAFASSLAGGFRVIVPFMVLCVVAVAALPGRRIRARLAEPNTTAEPMSLADAAAMGL